MSTQKYQGLGNITQLLTPTNLSAMTSNAVVTQSGSYNNTPGSGVGTGTGDGYVLARVTLIVTMNAGATANTSFALWFLRSNDGGTTFERAPTSSIQYRAPDVVFTAPTDTTQTVICKDILIPAGYFKASLCNNGTGQATKTDTTTAGTYLTIDPITVQTV